MSCVGVYTQLRSSKKLFLFSIFILLFCIGLLRSKHVQAEPRYTLTQIMEISTEHNPAINISKARQESASASVITTTSYSNPLLELGAGPTRYRTPGNLGRGGNWGISLSQSLDLPSVRQAKKEVAESNVHVAEIGVELTKADLRIKVKSAFYDVLQRQAIFALMNADLHLLEDIRSRVKKRVEVGEAPKYELIKAETEVLAAQRDYQTAKVRVYESKAYLRGLAGATIAEDYSVLGSLPLAASLPSIETLRDKIANAAQLKQIRSTIDTSQANLRLQEALRTPNVTLKFGIEQDPDLRQIRLGIAVPLPLWDHRQGPIAQAASDVKEAQAMLSDRELTIKRDIESAYQRYVIAQQQVTAFEEGLLAQAESVLKVAEAAYRFGERGILDYLDAQRTTRTVKKDYLSARHEYVISMMAIEHLLGHEFLEIK